MTYTFSVTVVFEERPGSVPGGITERIAVTHSLMNLPNDRAMAVAIAMRRVCARFEVEKVLAVEVTVRDVEGAEA